MTDIQKRIDEIVELDKKRTKGAWRCEPDTWKAPSHIIYAGEQFICKEHGAGMTSAEQYANAQFIAKAPEMVEIIQHLQQQLAERDELLHEAIFNAVSVVLEGSKYFCTEDEKIFVKKSKSNPNNGARMTEQEMREAFLKYGNYPNLDFLNDEMSVGHATFEGFKAAYQLQQTKLDKAIEALEAIEKSYRFFNATNIAQQALAEIRGKE